MEEERENLARAGGEYSYVISKDMDAMAEQRKDEDNGIGEEVKEEDVLSRLRTRDTPNAIV